MNPVPGASAWRSALERLNENPPVIADEERFPVAAIDRLREEGLLYAPLPQRYGGAGLGTEPGRGHDTLAFFHALGRLSLPLGRLLEAHVNAIRIVIRYGSAAQAAALAERVSGGALLGLWVTDPPGDDGLTLERAGRRLFLSGRKMFCSGAGQVQGAVVTALDRASGDRHLLLLILDGSEEVTPLPAGLTGMRAAVTGQVSLQQRVVPEDSLIGDAGDYLKEPDFSGGAWRSSAVALGGLWRLCELTGGALRARGRDGDPHQRARFGQIVMAHESGLLWLDHAGTMAEDLEAPMERIVATVGLARLAVERACLESLALAHRSLGLPAFLAGSPVERLTRDLQTYLRQPAADEVLDGAAAFFLAHPVPRP